MASFALHVITSAVRTTVADPRQVLAVKKAPDRIELTSPKNRVAADDSL